MNDSGYSWYINSDSDNVEVFKITEDMVTDKILKKYDSDLSICNLGRENMKNMFYDKDGWIYFKAEKYYKFPLQIKEFIGK
ncbi:hypothetical protein [uncultured Methanobrevibacter sp.]|uniref:hypothetical protein n=1 Tax=uncultured Methanobrevibacter sp. TaxID=253161 RepID=UPI0025F4BF45|nr:hypothetical protein [uncultured Methanobrevibacter sp.]